MPLLGKLFAHLAISCLHSCLHSRHEELADDGNFLVPGVYFAKGVICVSEAKRDTNSERRRGKREGRKRKEKREDVRHE